MASEGTIEFVIKLRGGSQAAEDARKVEQAVAGVGGKMKTVARESSAANKQVGSFGGHLKRLALGLGAVGAGYAAWNAAKNAITYTSELGKNTRTLASATHMGVGQTSALIGVSNALGVESTKLGMLFVKVSKATLAQAEHTGKAKTAYDKLGISTAEAKAHLNDTAGMLDIVTAKLKDGHIPAAEKASVMTELFGRGWQTLGPLLLEGDDNLKGLIKRAKDFGLDIGGSTAELKKFHEQQVEAKLATEGMQVSFAKLIAGPLGGILSSFAKLTVYARKGEWAKFDKGVQQMAHSFETLAEKVLPRVAQSFARIAPAVLKAFVKGFISAPIGTQLFMAGILASKLGLVGGIFKGIGSNMGKSMTKGMLAETPAFAAAGGALGTAFEVAFAAAAVALIAYAAYKLGMKLREVLHLGGTYYTDPQGNILTPDQIAAEQRAAARRSARDRKRTAAQHLHPQEGPHHLFRKTFGKGATGGTMLTPGMVEVGERGPEILNVPGGSQIAPLKPGSLLDERPIILKVDGRVLARVNRRETLQSQAAGA